MDVLSTHYGRVCKSELLRLLPGRSWVSIRGKSSRLMVTAKPCRSDWERLFRERPGLSATRYAMLCGVCRKTALKWMRKYDETKRTRP